jgi:hypothetical protein
VTIDGVWIGNRIYCTLTTRNYSVHTSQFTTTESPWTFSVSQLTTNYAEYLARARISCRPTSLTLLWRLNWTDWSKSLYDRRSVDQSVLVSNPIWGSWPYINFCLTLLFCRCRAPLWREVGSVICLSHLNCFSTVQQICCSRPSNWLFFLGGVPVM